MSPFRRIIATLSVTTILACKGQPSKEEIDKLIDERLAARGLAPLRSASGAPAAPGASAPPAPSATSPSDDAAGASLAFLARLDKLMADYKPNLPVIDDKSDVLRCITSDAANADTDVKKVASVLKKRKEAAKRERESKEREFYDVVYPLAFHYDLDWATRTPPGKEAVPSVQPTQPTYRPAPPTYGCWVPRFRDFLPGADEKFCTSQAPRGSDWRLRPAAPPVLLTPGSAGSPGRAALFTYTNSATPPTQPPELMSRMDAAGIKLPLRFACRVEDVVAEHERRTITCRSSAARPIRLRISGELRSPNVGDVVSVPLADTKRDPDGVLFEIPQSGPSPSFGSAFGTAIADAFKGAILASLGDGGATSAFGDDGDRRMGAWVIDADGPSLTVDAAATCPSMTEILASLGDAGAK
jgi:hypothetical protein